MGWRSPEQEAWLERRSPIELRVPDYIREIVEQLAFSAREDKKVDKRSGVSQRLPISVLENVASNAERRALLAGESVAVPRVLDIYAALPSITGKLELEYEGELKGGDTVARELIRLAVGKVFTRLFRRRESVAGGAVVRAGRIVEAGRKRRRRRRWCRSWARFTGLMEKTGMLGLGASEPDAVRAAAAEFILEGLYAHRRISRNEEAGFMAEPRRREPPGDEPKKSSQEAVPMKSIRYSRYTGDDFGLSAEDLMKALSDFFLESGFDNPYMQFSEWNQHSLEDLKRAIEQRARTRRDVRSGARRADPPATGTDERGAAGPVAEQTGAEAGG